MRSSRSHRGFVRTLARGLTAVAVTASLGRASRRPDAAENRPEPARRQGACGAGGLPVQGSRWPESPLDLGTRMLAVLCAEVPDATEVVAVESAFAVPLIDQATGAVLDRT